YNVAGLPAPVPHTAPVTIAGTAALPADADRFTTLLASYEGPTGVQSALQFALGEAGFSAVSLSAQVPHYLAAMPWPAAAAAVLRKLASETGTRAPLGELDAAADERKAQVDAAIAGRPDIQLLVRALEEGQAAA